jgi:hypothetical protein
VNEAVHKRTSVIPFRGVTQNNHKDGKEQEAGVSVRSSQFGR